MPLITIYRASTDWPGRDDVFVGVEHDINRFFHLVALTGGQPVPNGIRENQSGLALDVIDERQIITLWRRDLHMLAVGF